jgi:UDPglucose--hexose-1-phosphate uridylyltransferase
MNLMNTKSDLPHRRFNPLTQEWILVSPHRALRPWQGQVEKTPSENLPPYDPDCYLCPGNYRAGGKQNPIYTSTYVFDNDFPALLASSPSIQHSLSEVKEEKNSTQQVYQPIPSLKSEGTGLFHYEIVSGICRVVCFSPRHDLTLPELSTPDVEAVLQTWSDQTSELGRIPEIAYVQVFENKGAMMGCSNPHPHSQIWATSYIPNEPAKELAALANYRQETDSCLLCDYLSAELDHGDRVVTVNQHFAAVVPYWGIWPYEILVITRRHVGSLTDLDSSEIGGLADLLKQVTMRYDNLFEVSFPYSMGFHQTPTNGEPHMEAHLHAHFYPPLLRSATVRKFMVGFEMLAMPQRDLTPESAAEKLRSLHNVHYKLERNSRSDGYS